MGGRIQTYSFDKEGNMSSGSRITRISRMKYDPEIGIFGMDVNVVLRRPGARIAKRAILRRRIPSKHRLDRDEAIQFMKDRFDIEVIE